MLEQVILEKAKKIKLLICDVDGVLTDGRLFYSGRGEAYKAFNVKDGLGIKLLQSIEVSIAIITSRNSSIVKNRMTELGIEYIYQNQKNKTLAYTELLETLNLEESEVAYIGDDLPDLPLIERVGLGVAVADAHAVILERADWITTRKAGKGAVRELADLIIHAKGKAEEVVERYR
jgi:3-deoxy-D-manno-octulosonate 8-phosphate phosphatase (KDO 8-P phosphatase)